MAYESEKITAEKRFKRKHLITAITAVISTSFSLSTWAVMQFNVPAGTLEQSLLSIASQSEQSISFDPKTVEKFRGRPLNGQYSVEQAIQLELVGTPLMLKKTENGTLTITAQPSSADPAALVSAEQNAIENNNSLPTITVSGNADTSEDATVYNPSTSSAVTRTNLALQETAQSVQVLSRKLLDDQQTTSVEDALKNAGSVSLQGSNRGTGNFVYMRGFSLTSGSTDGMANASTQVNGSITGNTSIDGIERIEVLKGPQSVMSGSTSPAGTLNVVRKAPTSEQIRTIKTELARYGEVKSSIDLGGPLTDDKSFMYRLNASAMRADNVFPDFNGKRSAYVAPVLAWQGDKTYFKIGSEFNNSHTSGPAGTYYFDGKIQKRDVDRLGDKSDGFTQKSKDFYYELNHNMSDNLSFNSKASYQKSNVKIKLHELSAVFQNGDLLTHQFANRQSLDNFTMQNDVRWKLNSGFVTQNILLGFDYQRSKTDSYDLDNAVYSVITSPNNMDSYNFPPIPNANFKSYDISLIQKGIIIQDQIDMWNRLHLQLSVRRASYSSAGNTFFGNGDVNHTNYKTFKWVPSYGISFDITPDVTAYVNLLQSFYGTGSVDSVTGNMIKPSQGKSKEAGIKFSFLDDNLSLTTAVFEIQESNVAVTNQAGETVASEGRKVKGFDTDLSGQILPGWNITASYTFMLPDDPSNSSVTGDTTDTKPVGQPKHSASLWTSYEIQQGTFHGLGAGIGTQIASKTWNGAPDNYFKMGGWANVDTSIFYNQPKYKVAFGITNLFNRDLYYYSSTPNWISTRPGREYRLNLSYSF